MEQNNNNIIKELKDLNYKISDMIYDLEEQDNLLPLTDTKKKKRKTLFSKLFKKKNQLEEINNIMSTEESEDDYENVKSFSNIEAGQKLEVVTSAWDDKINKCTTICVNPVNFSRNLIMRSWYKEWIKLYKNDVREATKQQIDGNFKNHILPFIGDIPLKLIQPWHIQGLLNNISHLPRTQTVVYMQIKSCLQKAQDIGLINKNPISACKIVLHKGGKRRALDKYEQQKLLDYIKDNKNSFTNLILIYLNTGMRLSELLNITRSDIDRRHCEIHIRGTKTLSSDRYLQTSKEIIDLFPYGERPFKEFNRDIVERNFRNITKLLGFEGITIHCLRHTFATNCVENGVDMVVLQKWLGHSSISMTIDRYTHVGHNYKRKQKRKYQVKLPKE